MKVLRLNCVYAAGRTRRDLIWFSILFLACVDFMGKGSSFLTVLLLPYTAMHIRQVKLSRHAILLFLFSFSYFLSYWYCFGADITDVLKYLFFPWMSYMVGDALIRNSENNNPLLVLTFTITAGLFLHGTLNLLSYRFFHRVDESHMRLAFDFWSRKYLSVTAQGLLFLLPIGTSVGMLLSENKTQKKMAWLMLLVSAYNAALQAYRTFVAVIGIMILGAWLYLLLSSKINNKKRITVMAVTILLSALCIIFWHYNILSVKSLFRSSRLYQRLTADDLIHAGGRVNIWKSFFRSWLRYPFGGKKIELYRGHGFVHNFWLDIYRDAGVFPFLFSVMATLDEWILQRRYGRLEEDRSTVIIMNCVTAAITLGFMVEPVLVANPYVYYYFLLIQGGIWGTMRRKGGCSLQ